MDLYYESDYLVHHGTKGQKWGVKNGPPYPLSRSRVHKSASTNKAKSKSKKNDSTKKKSSSNPKSASTSSSSNKKSVKDMTDEELRQKINRMDLEKKYNEALKSSNTKKSIINGRQIVSKILTSSIENIGTQAVTYYMGKGFNKLLGEDAVNPKKGQKDKK